MRQSFITWKSAIALFLITVFLTSGCAPIAYQPEAHADEEQEHGIYVGDEVEIRTKDDRLLIFTVTKVNSRAVFGKNIKVYFNEIEEIHGASGSINLGQTLISGIIFSGGVIYAVSTWINERE